MATVHTNLTVGKTYAVTSANGCTVTLANGVEVELQAGQDYFTPDTPEVTVSDDTATVVQTFNHAPARRGGGGDITVDPTPTQGSENAVSSGGVYTALAGKQGTLTAGAGITLSGGTVSVNANGAVNATDTKPVSGQTVNAAIAAAVIGAGGAALDGNNTFTATNTFNGAVAFNGSATRPASAEAWTADTIMTLGMHQVGAWWDKLEADLLFNPYATELDGNALFVLEGTTDAVQVAGVEGAYPPDGKGLKGETGIAASNLVAGRITLNPRAQVKLHVAGTSEDTGRFTAFDSPAHPWLWVTWYKSGGRRDINLIGAYAAANSCPVVMVCDTHLSDVNNYQARPVTTKIVDVYLGSAPGRSGGGKAETVCLVLAGAKQGVTDLYIGFKGGVPNGQERRLMRHYTVPAFGFGEIGAISRTSWLPSVTAARGNLATAGAVTHKMTMWAYQGTYQPSDPAGSAAFFVKDAQTGMFEARNANYDQVQQQTVDVYLAEVQEEQPSTAPQDYTYSDTPHANKDDVEVPAAGGYVLAKIVADFKAAFSYYFDSVAAQAVVMDSWLADTEAGADADGHVLVDGQTQWKLSRSTSDGFGDPRTAQKTAYAYIKVPENTTGEERDGYAVIGATGMRASLIHIVQAAE